MNQPNNLNFLNQFGFKFIIQRLPTVSFFCQTATIPAISNAPLTQPTPLLSAPRPGNRLVYEPLTVRFKVDEDLANYQEIQQWLVETGSPSSTEQYRNLSPDTTGIVKTKDIVSDAILNILTSHKNPNKNVVYRDMFPTNLSELTFDSTDSDVVFLEATATFSYLRYEFI